jgi:hypothetical protein
MKEEGVTLAREKGNGNAVHGREPRIGEAETGCRLAFAISVLHVALLQEKKEKVLPDLLVVRRHAIEWIWKVSVTLLLLSLRDIHAEM